MVKQYLTKGRIGYVNEATYGSRRGHGTPASTQCFALGDMIGVFQIPIEKSADIEKNSFTGFDYGTIKRGPVSVDFELNYLLMEGFSLYYTLGATTEGGIDDAYTNTITGITPATTVELPSRTLHIEEDALTVPKFWDICGSVIQSIDYGGSIDAPGIQVKEKSVAQRITDEGGDTSLVVAEEIATAAITYTNEPAYMDSNLTTEDAYVLTAYTIGYGGAGGTDILPDIISWNINITNTFEPRRSNSAGVDNYGRSLNNYVGAYYLKKRRYTLTLNVKLTDNTIGLMNSQQDNVTDNVVAITFSRYNSTTTNTDSIVWNFDNNPSVCPIIDVTALTSFHSGSTFILKPKALVNVVVTEDVQTYDVDPAV